MLRNTQDLWTQTHISDPEKLSVNHHGSASLCLCWIDEVLMACHSLTTSLKRRVDKAGCWECVNFILQAEQMPKLEVP